MTHISFRNIINFTIQCMLFSMILWLSISNVALCSSNSDCDHNHKVFKEIKQFSQWSVVLEHEINDRTLRKQTRCYLIANPLYTHAFPDIANRKKSHFIALYLPRGRFTFSEYAGFKLNTYKGGEISVGQKIFGLRTYREIYGCTYSSTDDVALMNMMIQMRNDDFFTIRNYKKQNLSSALDFEDENNRENSTILDYYSMAGFRKAAKYAQWICDRDEMLD